MRHCKSCQEDKTESAFGASFYCKVCMADRMRIYRSNNPERARAIMRRSVEKNREARNARKRARRAANPERTKAERKASYEARREREILKMREWKASNRAQMSAQRRAKYYADVEASRAKQTAYRRRRPDLERAWRMTRIATNKQATPVWANYDLIKSIYMIAERIMRCTGIPHEVDHIVPLRGMIGRKHVVSGLHVDYNLRVIPKRMNRAKSNVCWPAMPACTSGA